MLRRARRRRAAQRNIAAYLFLAPALSFWLLFLVWPVVAMVRQSFQRGGILGPAEAVGVANWSEALADDKLRQALTNTLKYVGMTVPLVIVGALLVAVILNARHRGSALSRGTLILPSLAPIIVVGFLWQFIVHPDFGMANLVLRPLGFGPVNFLGDSTVALPTVAALDVWRGLGFWALFILAGLLAIPTDLYGAAAIDGASAIRRFWHVTLPGLRPTLVVAIVLVAVISAQVFDSVFILTNGGPAGATESAVSYMYKSLFEYANPGYGAVLSLILVGTTMVLTGLIGLIAARQLRR